MKEMTAHFKRLRTINKITLLMIAIAAAVVYALVFKKIASYELHHAYNWDCPLYWTVGRGMLNGLKPYADLYENKPLGVFLISAFSFWLTDDTIICNIVQVLAILAIAVLPAAALLTDRKCIDKSEITVVRYAETIFFVLLVGLLIAVFSEKRAGSFQTEAIGSAFSILFICLVKMQKNVTTRQKRIILTACSSLAVGCSVMLKEPFLFVSIFGALLFVESFKSFLKYILLPCAIGALFFSVILAVTGTFVPYITVYIKEMLTSKVIGNTSVFLRSLNVLRLFWDIKRASNLLFVLILLFILLALVRTFRNRKSAAHFIFGVIRIFAAVYVASFCVSIGGQYYIHHFVFAVPVYCAIIIYGAAYILEFAPRKVAPNLLILCLAILLMLSAALKTRASYRAYFEKYDTLKNHAQYVDELLDHYRADRYQFVGFNDGDKFFGLTKHSPLGPAFVQDPDNFREPTTWFNRNFRAQLKECDVIIMDRCMTRSIYRSVSKAVKEDFTYIPNDQLAVSPPDDFECIVYLRTSKYG